jgi:acetoin utilization protein AcuC
LPFFIFFYYYIAPPSYYFISSQTKGTDTVTMPQPRAAFIHSPDIERYHYPPSCPFKTERAALTKNILVSMGCFDGDGRSQVAPIAATESELLSFHTRPYIEALKRISKGVISPDDLLMGIGTDDTPVFTDLFDYANLAAGATMTGARLLINGSADIVFNPSGGYHHAKAGAAGGFCYVNDVVLGCNVLTAAGKKVFCLDLDAHHGNGTQEAFYNNPNVFTVSFHESGKTLFPWGGFETEIGEGAGLGYNVNVPLPAHTDDETFEKAFRLVVPPLIRAYNPDVIVLELGMDVLNADPLTHLSMTNNAIADALPLITQFSKPILAVGGGGYNSNNTARGWALLWCVLCGLDAESDMTIGMGGTFLGSSEWKAGLRDMRTYTQGEEKREIQDELARVAEYIEEKVFGIHGITE